MSIHFHGRLLLSTLFLLAGGCASYATPGKAADFRAMGISPAEQRVSTDGSIQHALDKKPLASFPTAIAVARVQAPGYRSRTAEGWGTGSYSLVTTRDVEDPQQMARLEKLPMVRGIATLNRLVVSTNLRSDEELRQAAAQLHADMVLVYTLDTTFYVRDMSTPLTVVSLGLSPNKQARVVTTASAVLLDTRNGYVYGAAEETARHNQLANAWTSQDAVDGSRLQTEKEAFNKLVVTLEQTWPKVVQQYGPSASAAQIAPSFAH